jgi:hypothetical protein
MNMVSSQSSTSAIPVIFSLIPSRGRRRRWGATTIGSEQSLRAGVGNLFQKDWQGRGLSNAEGQALGKALAAYGIKGGGIPGKTSDRGRQQIRSLTRQGRLPAQYRRFR